MGIFWGSPSLVRFGLDPGPTLSADHILKEGKVGAGAAWPYLVCLTPLPPHPTWST